MVTTFNPKDLIDFGNYCLEQLEKGMIEELHGAPEITKEHFDNWKVSKNITKREKGAQKSFIDFIKNVKDHGADHLDVRIADMANGMIEVIHFSNEAIGANGMMELSGDQMRILKFEGYFQNAMMA